MNSSHGVLIRMILFIGLVGLAFSTSISDDVFKMQGSGRSLLQAKTSCSVNFEFLNYTIITSKCKGPQYPAALCCLALKEFACPYADQLNDGTNDCASTMFSYINIYGKYPPGLFASECREGKEGLECTENMSEKDSASKSRANQIAGSLFVVLLGLFVTIFLW
ncbi:GPI-anchored protein LLG1-like [Carex rostrata]